MRTTTLLAIQTVVVVLGYLAATTTAGNACCRGASCHDIPPGCFCPFIKAMLCGDVNTLTMGKRNLEDRYETVLPPSAHHELPQQYLQLRPQQVLTKTDRRLENDWVVGVLNHFLKLLKETHQADQEAFDLRDQNEDEDWDVTTSRKEPSVFTHNVYRRHSLFSDDLH